MSEPTTSAPATAWQGETRGEGADAPAKPQILDVLVEIAVRISRQGRPSPEPEPADSEREAA